MLVIWGTNWQNRFKRIFNRFTVIFTLSAGLTNVSTAKSALQYHVLKFIAKTFAS